MTDTMLASVYVGGGRLEVRELPTPAVGPEDVLVEVSHCGICGTDLHLVLEEFARPGTVLGHEWSGTVAATGGGVKGWCPGDRVVANPTPGCGDCRACRRGRPSVCLRRSPPDYLAFSGAFCRYLAVPASRLSPIPDGLSMRAAALTEPTAIALHAVRLAAVAADDRVLVTGAGPVGLLIVAVLHSVGVRDITVSEPSARRRQRAVAVGASATITPDELSDVPIGRVAPTPWVVAFECSGRSRAASSALDHLDYAGTLVFVGTGSELPRLNHNRMIVFELTAIGAYNYNADGFGPAIQLLASGRLPVEQLVEPVDVLLDGMLPAMRRLAAGELASKVLVRPEVSM